MENETKIQKLKSWFSKNSWKSLGLLLLFLLCVSLIYSFFKVRGLESDFNDRQVEIVKKYDFKIDSLSVSNITLTAKVFTWAIRSEMTRENMEQVDQFFLNFIKEKNVEKIKLINPSSGMILLSTDKKEEGEIYADLDNLKFAQDSIYIQTNEDSHIVYCPVMGLDKKIGVLIIDIAKSK